MISQSVQFQDVKEGYTMPQTIDAKGQWMQRVLAADTLTGDKVVNRQKEDLGTIEHLMIDVEQGRIAYAVHPLACSRRRYCRKTVHPERR
jgi:hypothetical protein